MPTEAEFVARFDAAKRRKVPVLEATEEDLGKFPGARRCPGGAASRHHAGRLSARWNNPR
jgi:hypothetical protein